MTERLYVRLPDAIDDDGHWLLLDDQTGVVRSRGGGPLRELTAFISEEGWFGEIVAVVGGQYVLLTFAQVPSRQKRQIVQAVPFVVEEQLATEVERMHLAIGERGDDDMIAVAAVAESAMASWLAALAEAGLEPDYLVTDAQCLQPDGADYVILIENEFASICGSNGSRQTIERDQLSVWFELAGADAEVEDELPTVRVLVESDVLEAMRLEISQWTAETGFAIEAALMDYQPFEVLCRGFSADALNLLQGDYAPAKRGYQPGREWRSVAVLGVSFLLVHLVLTIARGVYVDVEATRLATEAEALYADVFPNDRNVRDIRRRWRGHLNQGSDGETTKFLAVLRESARGMSGSRLQVQNLNYNEQRGDLILQMSAPSSAQLVAYSEKLNTLGFAAEIGSINQDEGIVKGTVKVSTGGRP